MYFKMLAVHVTPLVSWKESTPETQFEVNLKQC